MHKPNGPERPIMYTCCTISDWYHPEATQKASKIECPKAKASILHSWAFIYFKGAKNSQTSHQPQSKDKKLRNIKCEQNHFCSFSSPVKLGTILVLVFFWKHQARWHWEVVRRIASTAPLAPPEQHSFWLISRAAPRVTNAWLVGSFLPSSWFSGKWVYLHVPPILVSFHLWEIFHFHDYGMKGYFTWVFSTNIRKYNH